MLRDEPLTPTPTHSGGETSRPILKPESWVATRGWAEEGGGDMFYFLTPGSMKYRDVTQPMDVVGRYSEARFQGRINATTAMSEKPHYPSFIYYNQLWNFYQVHNQDELGADEQSSEMRAVTVGWCGSHWRYNPRNGDLSDYVPGSGHLGGLDSNHNQGARRGEPALLVSERQVDPRFVPIM